MSLAEKLLAIHAALDKAGFDHAFGGAIALAFWTLDPRGTSDIDVNIFVSGDEAAAALAALPDEIASDNDSLEMIERESQVRLWWAGTPIDLFFSYEQLHTAAADHRRSVPFAGEQIPILAPLELACFKAAFDRTKDWADIEAMLLAETLDPDALRGELTRLVGESDRRLDRLADAVVNADEAAAAQGSGEGPSLSTTA